MTLLASIFDDLQLAVFTSYTHTKEQTYLKIIPYENFFIDNLKSNFLLL